MRLIINPKQEPAMYHPSLTKRNQEVRDLRLFLYLTAAYVGGLAVAVILSNA